MNKFIQLLFIITVFVILFYGSTDQIVIPQEICMNKIMSLNEAKSLNKHMCIYQHLY